MCHWFFWYWEMDTDLLDRHGVVSSHHLQLETLSMQILHSHPILHVSIKIEPAWIQMEMNHNLALVKGTFSQCKITCCTKEIRNSCSTGKNIAALDLQQTPARRALGHCSGAGSLPGPPCKLIRTVTSREPQTEILYSINMLILKSYFLYLLVSHTKMIKIYYLLNFSKLQVSLATGGAWQLAIYFGWWQNTSGRYLFLSCNSLGQCMAQACSVRSCQQNQPESLQQTKNALNHREFMERFTF